MKKDRINILGVGFDPITMKKAVDKAFGYLESEKPKMIFTANPEIVMAATESNAFMEIMNKGDLVVADGIGVVIGSKILKKPLPERVAGYDLVQNLFAKMKNTEHTAYFFGAAPGIAEKARKKMNKQYPGLKVVGSHDGYFDEAEEKKIIEEIQALKPSLLLVGLGAPKQEQWINANKDSLNVKLCIGVGGSFDVMSGTLKRAPKIFIKLGLEWFYRLISQPTRIKRMMKLPLFLLVVFKRRKEFR